MLTSQQRVRASLSAAIPTSSAAGAQYRGSDAPRIPWGAGTARVDESGVTQDKDATQPAATDEEIAMNERKDTAEAGGRSGSGSVSPPGFDATAAAAAIEGENTFLFWRAWHASFAWLAHHRLANRRLLTGVSAGGDTAVYMCQQQTPAYIPGLVLS